jgi:hypothetical protein
VTIVEAAASLLGDVWPTEVTRPENIIPAAFIICGDVIGPGLAGARGGKTGGSGSRIGCTKPPSVWLAWGFAGTSKLSAGMCCAAVSRGTIKIDEKTASRIHRFPAITNHLEEQSAQRVWETDVILWRAREILE